MTKEKIDVRILKKVLAYAVLFSLTLSYFEFNAFWSVYSLFALAVLVHDDIKYYKINRQSKKQI